MKVLNSETDSLGPALKVTQPLRARFERYVRWHFMFITVLLISSFSYA